MSEISFTASSEIWAPESFPKRQVWFFLVLAYVLTWTVWLVAQALGVGPDHHEYFAAFGTPGPALAAIFLSRRGRLPGVQNLPTRLLPLSVLWLLGWATYIANDRLRGIHAPSSFLYYSAVGLLSLIPAWILSGGFPRDLGVRELLDTFLHPSRGRWPVISFFFWPVMLLTPAGIVHFVHLRLVMPHHTGSLSLFVAYAGIFFVNNFLFTAALEEPGWRGYLLPHLQQRFSPLVSSLLVWLPWALWHAPLDFHQPFRFTLVEYLLIRVVFLIPITIILTWFYNRSGRSLLTVALFHTGMNTFPFVLPNFPPAAALVMLFAVVIVFTDRMWRRLPASR